MISNFACDKKKKLLSFTCSYSFDCLDPFFKDSWMILKTKFICTSCLDEVWTQNFVTLIYHAQTTYFLNFFYLMIYAEKKYLLLWGLVWLYCSLGKTVQDFAGANAEIGHFVLLLVFQLVSHRDRSDSDC